jgi:predicted MFS family arabinose efflux permease
MLVAFFTLGITVGGVEVAVPAALDDMGHRSLTGLCLGLWGVGSVFGGLAMTRTRPPADPAGRLLVLIAAWAAAHLALAAAGAPVLLGTLLLVAGATIAPTFTVANGLLDRLAPTGTLTEAFTWTSTGMTAGAAAGSAVGGLVVEAADAAAALALLGGAALAGAALLMLARGPLSRPLAA